MYGFIKKIAFGPGQNFLFTGLGGPGFNKIIVQFDNFCPPPAGFLPVAATTNAIAQQSRVSVDRGQAVRRGWPLLKGLLGRGPVELARRNKITEAGPLRDQIIGVGGQAPNAQLSDSSQISP